MTTTSDQVATPDLGIPLGSYAGTRVTHVRNLLSRANVPTNGLTPTIVAKMRRHYQVSSGLIVQSLPLIRADWSIECEDDRIREQLTAAYRSIAFTLHRSMTRALWAGYSPNTLTWNRVESLNLLFPTEVRDLVPSTCEPAVDENGTLAGFVQKVGGAVDGEFDPIYSLWITEGLESGNYYGRSILDAALDPWADHAAIRAFHARYLERFGEPVVIARAPAGKTISNKAEIELAIATGQTPPDPRLEDNLDAALEMGENLRHHTVVALPSSLLFGADGKPTGFAWNLEFLEAKGGHGTDFLEAIRETDKRIGRAMFVPDLLTGNGDTGGSVANALGATHRTVWTESVEGRLDDYSRQITDQLLEPVRRLNYGDRAPAVRLVFSPLADDERDRLWSLVVALVDNGELPIDGRELAERYDLPVLDPGEVPAAPPVDPNMRRPLSNGVDLEREEDRGIVGHSSPIPGVLFAAEDPVAGLPDWKLPQSWDPPPYRRELNDRERRVGFAAIEGGMNDAEARILSLLSDVLDREHDRVLRQITGIVRKGTAAEVLAALGTLEIKGGPEVSRAWSDLMADVATIATDQLRTELAAYADAIKDPGPEARALFKAYASTAAERVVGGLVTETRLQLLNAYTSGVSRAGMAAIVGQIFDAYQGSEGKPVRLTTRMLSSKSLNYSRAAAVERGGIPLAGAQYSAILDRRTCDLCAKLDEKVIPIESTDLARFTPPIHHNCRCLWIWITRDEEDFTPTWSTPSASDVDRFGGLVF